MRIQAIRASETLYKAGDKSFAADYKKFTADPDVDVVIQALLTINKWKVPDAESTIKAVAATNKAKGVQLVANVALNPAAAAGRGGGGRGGGPVPSPEEAAALEKGGQIYGELCFSCHGTDGFGAPKAGTSGTMAPPLAGSPRVNGHRDYIIKTVLYGMTGPIDGKTYSEIMIPNNVQADDWVAAVASYVRTSFGNNAGMVTAADVKRVRADVGTRKNAWTLPEIERTLPRVLTPDTTSWKVSASHNSGAAATALSMTGWNSQAPQAPGMWFQVELPAAAMVTELQFDSPGGGRGGGGGGRAAAPPAGALQGRGAGAPGAAPPNLGYPRGYKVETSMNGTAWTQVAAGTGAGAHTTATFKPTQAKFVRLTQTASTENAPPLSIQQFRLYDVAPTK
jgi:mono/diheme cytochrome c family protein